MMKKVHTTQYLTHLYYIKESKRAYRTETFWIWSPLRIAMVFPGGSDDKESACNTGNLGSIPGSRRSPGEGICNPLQYFCLGNPIDRRARWATVHGVAQSQTRLGTHITIKL